MARRTAPPPPVAEPLIEVHTPDHTLSRLPLRCLREEPGHNPRTDYGERDGTFAALVESIRRDGLLEPILVRQVPDMIDDWYIVAGHRRAAAAKVAGLVNVPCLWVTGDHNPVALALAENLQRRDLNPLEEAEGFQRLESLGWSQEAIGRTVGRSQSHVSRALSLLGLPEGTRTMLREGLLSASHGAELVPMPGAGVPTEDIDTLAGNAAEHGWSVGTLRVNAQSLVDRERGRERAAQTTIPVDDEPAREYATSHKSAASTATSSDALTRPADPAPEVKPGYTPADAKAEYEAAQQPDPDEKTPVQDALRAARDQALSAEAEPAGWETTGRMTPEERHAWLYRHGMQSPQAIDKLRALMESDSQLSEAWWKAHSFLPPRTYTIPENVYADLLAAGYEDTAADSAYVGEVQFWDVVADALEYKTLMPRLMDFSEAQIEALRPLAEARKVAGKFSAYGWGDYVLWLIDSAIAGRPILAPDADALLGKIAAHYSQSPADYLLAMLTARAEALGLTGKGEVA
jgi:ParB family chromosome partitioning protein